MRNIICGFGLVVITAGWLGFLCWLLGGCAATQKATDQGPCSLADHSARITAAFTKHVDECADFDGGVDDCPGYKAAKAEVEQLRNDYAAGKGPSCHASR